MLKEFKEFALKGNVLDMAVGIIIGVAFATVVKSMVNDVLMPPIGVLLGGIDFSEYFVNLSALPVESVAAAKEAGLPIIAYGLLINAIIEFLIVAFAIFMVIRWVNKVRKAMERQEEEVTQSEPAAPPRQEVLLSEIRDLLHSAAKA